MNARLQANLIRLLARSASNPAFAAAVASERNRAVYRAQSILFGIPGRDGLASHILTANQAIDVIRWSEGRRYA